MQSGCDGSRNVRNVGKHACADTASDLSDAFEVDDAWISRGAADEQLRPVLFGNPLQFVVIDLFSLFRNTVVGNFVTETGEVQRMTVSQMPTMREIHSEDLIAILNRRQINRHVCLRAAVWLHVGVIGAKQLLRAIDRCLLNDVGPFTTTVVTLSRITFSVLVRKHRTRGSSTASLTKFSEAISSSPLA